MEYSQDNIVPSDSEIVNINIINNYSKKQDNNNNIKFTKIIISIINLLSLSISIIISIHENRIIFIFTPIIIFIKTILNFKFIKFFEISYRLIYSNPKKNYRILFIFIIFIHFSCTFLVFFVLFVYFSDI